MNKYKLEQYKMELPRLKELKKRLVEQRRNAKYNFERIDVYLKNVERKIKIRNKYI